MRIVVALGGNSLLKPGEPLTEKAQLENVKVAAAVIRDLARAHEVIVTHGNGPQVGLLALEGEAYKELPPYGLDVLVAETQGMIGFMLEQALRNEINHCGMATIVTSVLVDRADPAFEHPTKPIGPVYPDKESAVLLAAERGWQVVDVPGGVRRIVPSPEPTSILQMLAITTLVDASILVICAGGGGVPVVATEDGRLEGVAAVVDKDLSSALIAEAVRADRLLLLTDVPYVYKNWGTPDATPILSARPDELRVLPLAAGSMSPKVEAACRFVERTGGEAVIGALSEAVALLEGTAGTLVSTA
jgi:carbamate kinase